MIKILCILSLLMPFNSLANPKTLQQQFCDANAANLEVNPEMPGSLKCVPIPIPFTLDEVGNKIPLTSNIIKNQASLIALGKMLFWDAQVGSDGVACASCHFHAGADNRVKNQIDPGLRNASGKVINKSPIGTLFNNTFTNPKLKGPNYTLKKNDFPFIKYQEGTGPATQSDRNAPIVFESDDVVSSQGVFHSTFTGLIGSAEQCIKKFPKTGLTAPIFNVKGDSVRQVEPRNTPTVINAVYNFRNFWDGRANNIFNGINPFGLRKSGGSEIYISTKNKFTKQPIAIYNASLASQAVGPALSDMEMSCAGKSFADLGKKLLLVRPLLSQKIDSTDSVLGKYLDRSGNLPPTITYKSLIKAAFADQYWNAEESKKIDGHTIMENNFSLYWGLAVQAYESTLVSDDSRFDQAANGIDNLTPQEQNGLNLFLNKGKCVACHLGAEFTAASTSHVENALDIPSIGKYTERMLMGDGGFALYDSGFYNIGVRPTEEDIGIGGTDAYGNPLSFARNAKTHADGSSNVSLTPDPFNTNSYLFPYNIGCINWNPITSWGQLCGGDPVVSDERDAIDGAFKTPTLRNVELTGPYFHNGGHATLEQTIQFYNRGGDRKDLYQKDIDCGGPKFTSDQYGNAVVVGDNKTGLIDNSGFLPGYFSNIAPDMAGTKETLVLDCNPYQQPSEDLGLSDGDISDIVAFLKSLTDERVRWEKAPFDHPSLVIPNGHIGNENGVFGNPALEEKRVLQAVGAKGRDPKKSIPLLSFENGLK